MVDHNVYPIICDMVKHGVPIRRDKVKHNVSNKMRHGKINAWI